MSADKGRLDAVVAIVRDAGMLARKTFRSRVQDSGYELKGPHDYVSEADRQVEDLLRARLAERFPGECFLGEERGGATDDDALWVADPIDGTSNFVRGIPAFCVSLAFLREGRIEIGIVYDPMQDEMFTAQLGQGAWLNGELLHVSQETDITRATVEAGWSTRVPMSRYLALLGRLTDAGAGIRRAGSGALAIAYVAAGRLDAYCEIHINAWDVLAGILLVREAGGWTSDFLAGDGLRSGNPILACTPALVSQLEPLFRA